MSYQGDDRGSADEIAAFRQGAMSPASADERAAAVERLRPRTVSEVRAAKPPRWLVRNIALSQSLILIWGASGSGKTFLTLDLAMAVARGRNWFGNRVRQGGVIYIAGEGHLKFRLDAYCEQHEVGDGDLDQMRIVASSVNLLDPGADMLPLLAGLEESAKTLDSVQLVVLDTLNAMMPGGDENSSEDMGRMIAAARKIMQTLDCAVILVHHGGKDEGRGARGHSSLKAAVDSELFVKSTETGLDRSVSVEKVRDGETGQEYAFRLVAVDLGDSQDPDAEKGERVSSCVVERSEAAAPKRAQRMPRGTELAMKALQTALSEAGATMPATSAIPPHTKAVGGDRWRYAYYCLDAPDPKGDPAKERAACRKRFDRARMALLNANMVGGVNDLYWAF